MRALFWMVVGGALTFAYLTGAFDVTQEQVLEVLKQHNPLVEEAR